MKCDIYNCEQEATYIITTKMNTDTMVCSTHLKRIIDGVDKLSMRRFVGIKSMPKERIDNGIVQSQVRGREATGTTS